MTFLDHLRIEQTTLSWDSDWSRYVRNGGRVDVTQRWERDQIVQYIVRGTSIGNYRGLLRANSDAFLLLVWHPMERYALPRRAWASRVRKDYYVSFTQDEIDAVIRTWCGSGELQRVKPCDDVPWEVHLIDDPVARQTAYTTYVDAAKGAK